MAMEKCDGIMKNLCPQSQLGVLRSILKSEGVDVSQVELDGEEFLLTYRALGVFRNIKYDSGEYLWSYNGFDDKALFGRGYHIKG